jgi:uncharacterized protein (TIGR02246 family)
MQTRTTLAAAALLAAGALLGWLAASGRLAPTTLAQQRPAAGDPNLGQPDSPEMAAVRKTAEAFTKAFNAGDAKAVAAFWTKDGEFVGADGETVHGRDQIEKTYVAFFKQHPKAIIEVEIQSVRLLGRHTALEEGSLKLRLPGDKEPGVSRYSVLHVREDDGWKMASVREWVPDPQELVTLKDLEWLLGEWTAKSDEAEVRITYAWDEDKAFLRGRYVLKRGGKAASSGTQIIGKNPGGGLRSWVFDSSGTFGESLWSREENRWVIEAAGTLPDGSEVTAVNLLMPLGKDAFTWQSVERTVAGSTLPDTPPLKVTRVK